MSTESKLSYKDTLTLSLSPEELAAADRSIVYMNKQSGRPMSKHDYMNIMKSIDQSSQMLDKVMYIEEFIRTAKMQGLLFKDIRQKLYQLGVKTSYDDERIIFSAAHNARGSMDNFYCQEANGLILNKNTLKPLMVPPMALRHNIDTQSSNEYLAQGKYTIYKAMDGTAFNMYYFNGLWRISTYGGYDMADIKWNSKTYYEMIEECLQHADMSFDELTQSLDPLHCYSFGFKHPNAHKFYESHDDSEPTYKLWFLQSVCLDKSSPMYLQSSDEPPCTLPLQEKVLYTVNDLGELYKHASSAWTNYVKGGEPVYGFILRSNDFNETLSHSNLFIESSLLRTIRRSWYDRKSLAECSHNNEWRLEKNAIVNAYLMGDLADNFILLFPRFKHYFTHIDNIVHCVAEQMVSLSFDEELKEITFPECEHKCSFVIPTFDTLVQLSKTFLAAFNKQNTFKTKSINKSQKKRYYGQFLVDKIHASTFLTLWD